MLKYFFKSPKPSKTNYEFKMEFSFEKRKRESEKVKQMEPDKIPIIVERSDSVIVKDIDKHKFLIKKDITVGSLIYILKQKLSFGPEIPIYLYVENEKIPKISDTLGDLYELYADKDGYLYFTYSIECFFAK